MPEVVADRCRSCGSPQLVPVDRLRSRCAYCQQMHTVIGHAAPPTGALNCRCGGIAAGYCTQCGEAQCAFHWEQAIEQKPVSGRALDALVRLLCFNAAGSVERRRCVACREEAAGNGLRVFLEQTYEEDPFERAHELMSWGFDPSVCFAAFFSADLPSLGAHAARALWQRGVRTAKLKVKDGSTRLRAPRRECYAVHGKPAVLDTSGQWWWFQRGALVVQDAYGTVMPPGNWAYAVDLVYFLLSVHRVGEPLGFLGRIGALAAK